MLKRLLLLVATLSLMAVPAYAQDAELAFTQYELDNGLQVILVPDDSAPTVAVDVWYTVGGANDADGLTGFAHLFEHMMFEGSANVDAGEHFEIVSQAGASFNAYTSRERTAYFQAVPAHYLPVMLWLEADRMASLRVSGENLRNQRDIVLQEYQQNYSNDPFAGLVEQLYTTTYNYEPYQNLIIGQPEDIAAATIEDVIDFHDTYYVPNNATLVVAGDFDMASTTETIERFFAEIPAGDPAPALPDYTFELAAAPVEMELDSTLATVPVVVSAWEIPGVADDDFPAFTVLDALMSSGNSSRLVQNVEETGLALSSFTFLDSNREASFFAIGAIPNFGRELEEVEAATFAELTRIAEEGVPTEELEKVINQNVVSSVLELETVLGLAEAVQAAEFYFDDPAAVYTAIERLEAVTSADIQRVIETYLLPEARRRYVLTPGDTAPTAIEDLDLIELDDDTVNEPDFVLSQTEAPEPLPVAEFGLPPIEQVVLDNGLEVMMVQIDDMPLISMSVYLPGGGSAAPADLAGVAGITARALTRGTETRTAAEIASTIEQTGGSIGSSASADSFSLSLLVDASFTDLAFEMVSDVLFNPTFPEDVVANERDLALQSLQSSLSEAGTLAGRAFSSLVFTDHPYGTLQTEATLNAIDRDAVVSYYERILDPDGALLVAVGDVTYADLEAQIADTFGDWEPNPGAFVRDFAPATSAAPAVYLVNRPDSTQAQLAIGNLGISGTDPDRIEASVMNSILGGSVASRLFRTVREELGYTYGIGSSVNFPVDRGRFIISGSTGNELVVPAVEEIIRQVEDLQANPVDEAELSLIKDDMIGSYSLSLESSQSLAGSLASLRLRDQPISALSDYTATVAAVDAEAVQSQAQRVILPDEWIVVVVGDADVLQEPLSALGEVQVIDPR